MANPEREIKDMDDLMDKLSNVSSDLDGVVLSDYICIINSVIVEWRDSTKGCIEELTEQVEELEG